MRSEKSLLASIVTLICFSSACTSAATIHLKTGGVVEGTIEHSDESSISVVPDHDEAAVRDVQRIDIEDIEHSGETTFMAGAVLLGLALADVAIVLPLLSEDRTGGGILFFVALPTLTFTGVGVPLLGWGLSEMLSSKVRAGDPDAESEAFTTAIVGTTATGIALILGVVGAVMFKTAPEQEDRLIGGVLAFSGVGLLAVGLSVMIPGWLGYTDANDSDTSSAIHISPFATSHDGQMYYGAGVTVRW